MFRCSRWSSVTTVGFRELQGATLRSGRIFARSGGLKRVELEHGMSAFGADATAGPRQCELSSDRHALLKAAALSAR